MAQFKFGTFNFPDRLIQWGSFKAKPNQRQDKDSYTDGFGETQRNAIAHTKTHIQFTTLPMSSADMDTIMTGMVNNYTNYLERDAMCTYYDDENRVFKTGHFYFDPSFEFNRVEVDTRGLPTKYGEMSWSFIEY